jgi:YVTN family beta-propeller protein
VVVAGNTTSRNVAIINGNTGVVQGYVDTGDRVLDLAVTPNGQYAVVCNTDASTVSIVNTATRTVAANLNVPTRPAKVKLSADGTKAYVLSVAGTDMIHFINVAGAASTVTGTAIAGQTGTAQGYAYTDNSGIELSPDGSLLAVCVSFDDQVKLIDTTTRAIVATVPVGIDAVNMEFPMRAAFSPDGTKLYVTMAFGDAVAVVNVAGAASSRITTMPCADFPLTVNVDPAGQFVYVGTSGNNPGVWVYSTATNSLATVVGTGGGTVRAASLDNGVLYAAGLNNNTGGKLWRITAAGAGSSMLDETSLSSNPSDMVFNPATRKAYIAQPVPDWVDVVAVALPCGNADFNGDGDFGTDADIEAFFACLAGNCCATCYPGGSDFNADGDAGTDADIESFFRVLAGGAC